MNTMHSRFSQKGFTLIETLVAIFILALTIGALLTLTAGGFFSIRYAKNDIVAANLLQESLEYIRNDRDTAYQDGTITWSQWRDVYRAQGCYDSDGCIINPYTNTGTPISACTTMTTSEGLRVPCEPLSYYSDAAMYGYESTGKIFTTTVTPITTSFIRVIRFTDITTPAGDPQLKITARMDWKNGTNPKSTEQSIILTPWNLPQ